jgi:PAS domain S-box-containing protein
MNSPTYEDLLARLSEERQQLERRIAELDAVFDSLAEPLLVSHADGTLMRVNPAFTRLFGTPEDWAGMSLADRIRQVRLLTADGEPVAPMETPGARALAGETVHGVLQQLTREDGSVLHLSTSAAPVRTAEGVVGAAVVFTDVTERVRAEQALRESQAALATLARLYEVLSRANETMVRTRDEQTLFERICHIVAEIGGFPLVWIGMVNGDVVTPVSWCGPASSYLEAIKVKLDGELSKGPTGTAVREGRPVVNHDFDTNPSTAPWRTAALEHGIRASASFPLHRDGQPVGALTLYATRAGAFDEEHVRLLDALRANLSYALDALAHERHRTLAERALRDSERSLREVDQRKNEFLAVLSHELRNPLAPIVNSLYVLDHAAPVSDEARRAREVIGRQVVQLSNLVNDLLDVTRIARNKVRLQKAHVELGDVVGRVVEDHRFLFERAEIRLEYSPAPGPLRLYADRTRVAQVVGNLLHNAAKFTGKGGQTHVSVEPSGREAVLRVRDDGVGMDAETIARLFQPFNQADKTLHRSKGGLGLGLALVRGLVELHGGRVAAHSEGLGKGSELVVVLPLDDEATLDPSPKDVVPSQVRRRVLIIEDNVDAAESLCEALSIGHHEVAVAYDGRRGLAKARDFRPDVILCDIGLPGMDGFAVARAIRSDDVLRKGFLVALSGYALPEDLERAREAGFDRHLAKPPSLESLQRLLAEAPKLPVGS